MGTFHSRVFLFVLGAILPCTNFLLSVFIRRMVVLERLSCLKGFSLSSGTTTYFPLPVSSSKTLCKVYSRFLGSFPLSFLTFSAAFCACFCFFFNLSLPVNSEAQSSVKTFPASSVKTVSLAFSLCLCSRCTRFLWYLPFSCDCL